MFPSIFGSPKPKASPPTPADEQTLKRAREGSSPKGPTPINVHSDPSIAVDPPIPDGFRNFFFNEYTPYILAKFQVECRSTIVNEITAMKEDLLKEATASFRTIQADQIGEIVEEKMQDVATALETRFTTEINTVKATIAAEVERHCNATLDTTIASKMSHLDESVRATWDVFEDKLSHVSSSVQALERKELSTNIVLRGVVEGSGEQTLNEVKSLLGASNIVECKRMGKFDPQRHSKKPRPVLMKFCSQDAKHAAFQQKKTLRDSKKIIMDDHLTKEQLEERQRKQPWATALRQEGFHTYWKGENLFKVKEGQNHEKVDAPPPSLRTTTSKAAASSSSKK